MNAKGPRIHRHGGLGARIAFAAVLGWLAFPSPARSADILGVIQKLQQEAIQHIVANQGQARFDALRQSIAAKYPPSQYPWPAGPQSCVDATAASQGGKEPPPGKIADQAQVYFVVGVEAVLRGAHDAAAWAFAEAARMAPACPTYLANLAFVAGKQGHCPDALTLYEAARTMDPGNSSIYYGMAVCLKALGRNDEARQAALMAQALQPKLDKYKQFAASIPKNPPQAKSGKPAKPALDSALKILEEQKKTENAAQQAETWESAARGGGAGKDGDSKSNSRAGGSLISNQDMAQINLWMGDMRAGLLKGISAYEGAAVQAKQDAGKYAFGSVAHVAREVAATANLMMSDLLKGYLQDWDQAFTGRKDGWDDTALNDWFSSRAAKDLDRLKKAGEADTHRLYKVSLGPISLEQKSDGTYNFKLNAGIVGTEWKYNPDTFNFGFKVSIGPTLKFAGPWIGGSAGAEVYFACDLDKGPVLGTKVSDKVGLPLGDFGMTPLNLESNLSKEITVGEAYDKAKQAYYNLKSFIFE